MKNELLQRFHSNAVQPLAQVVSLDAVRNGVLALPSKSGAYCWYYADVTAGEYTAVFIFMVGSLFSPGYSRAANRGGDPQQFSAVNHALYRNGKRVRWVYSEYPEAKLERRTGGGWSLRIGASSFTTLPNGVVKIALEDRTAPWGRPTRAFATLRSVSSGVPEQQLVAGQPHYWRAPMPRATAELELPQDANEPLQGHGYHDANRGDELLGGGLPSWQWSRIHLQDRTLIWYRLPGGAPCLQVSVTENEVSLSRSKEEELAGLRTGWGLSVPKVFLPSRSDGVSSGLLESSPFYARLESRAAGYHALAEVADFRRFHSPFIRWMAHFRMRRGRLPHVAPALPASVEEPS